MLGWVKLVDLHRVLCQVNPRMVQTILESGWMRIGHELMDTHSQPDPFAMLHPIDKKQIMELGRVKG